MHSAHSDGSCSATPPHLALIVLLSPAARPSCAASPAATCTSLLGWLQAPPIAPSLQQPALSYSFSPLPFNLVKLSSCIHLLECPACLPASIPPCSPACLPSPQAKAVFTDQAPLQNRVPGWSLGSKGCYDEATLRSLQQTLATDLGAIAEGNASGGERCGCSLERALVTPIYTPSSKFYAGRNPCRQAAGRACMQAGRPTNSWTHVCTVIWHPTCLPRQVWHHPAFPYHFYPLPRLPEPPATPRNPSHPPLRDASL